MIQWYVGVWRSWWPSLTKDVFMMKSRAIAALEGAGIFGVELFLMPDDSIILNEIAPRCVSRCIALHCVGCL